MHYTINYGHGRVSESFATLDDAKAHILREYPDANISDEWEPSAPGYEALRVVVGEEASDVHHIVRDIPDHPTLRIVPVGAAQFHASLDYGPDATLLQIDLERHVVTFCAGRVTEDGQWEGTDETVISAARAALANETPVSVDDITSALPEIA